MFIFKKQRYMKNLFIYIVLLTNIVIAQNNDSIRIANVKYEINELKILLNNSTYLIDNSFNINEIHYLSSNVYKKSSSIADSIKSIYKLDCSDDDYLYGMYIGMSAAYSVSNPTLSVIYSSLATSSLLNDDCKSPPNYYDDIKEIRNLSDRISSTNNLKRIKKINLNLIRLNL